jgi:hypothetical protein
MQWLWLALVLVLALALALTPSLTRGGGLRTHY